jgi:hypothetical protein
MTKGQLIDLVLTDDEKRSIDTALPQNFVDDCINLLNVDPRHYFVWSYMENSVMGKPLNLAELYVERFLSIHASSGNIIDLNEEVVNNFLAIMKQVSERQSKLIRNGRE